MRAGAAANARAAEEASIDSHIENVVAASAGTQILPKSGSLLKEDFVLLQHATAAAAAEKLVSLTAFTDGKEKEKMKKMCSRIVCVGGSHTCLI